MTFLQDQALQQLRLGTCLNTVDSPPRGPALIPLDAMRRHVCILGSTGSGKSTTSAIICKELASLKVPVTILDRTGEYAQPFESTGAKVLRPGDGMAMTLFGLSKGETPRPLSSLVEDWLSLLDDYFHVSFSAGMSPLQARVLREVFAGYYQGTKETLTVSRLISRLEAYSKETRDLSGWVESTEALVSRLYPLTVDLVGATLDRSWDTFQVGQLFEPGLTILDLSGLPDDRSRNLVSQIVLKRVFEHVRRLGRSQDLRLVTVVDEAQHLAPNSDSYISVPERCAIELRKYGFCLVMCATRPSLISQNVVANSHVLIAHMLNDRRDIERVADHFVGSKEHLSEMIRTLPVGYALIQVNHPVPRQAMLCRMEPTGWAAATR